MYCRVQFAYQTMTTPPELCLLWKAQHIAVACKLAAWSAANLAARSSPACARRMTSAGVNRADCSQREGNYPPPAGASPTLGLECCGVVQEARALLTSPTSLPAAPRLGRHYRLLCEEKRSTCSRLLNLARTVSVLSPATRATA